MKYEVRFTSQFKKDLKLSAKQGKDTDKLFSVVEKLANGETLEEKYRDHTLSGDYNAADGFFVKSFTYRLFYGII